MEVRDYSSVLRHIVRSAIPSITFSQDHEVKPLPCGWIAAVTAVIAAVPLSLLIFSRIVPVVAGVPFSREASRLLTAGLLVSAIGIGYLAKLISDNAGTTRSYDRR